jgi:hypothetical protein
MKNYIATALCLYALSSYAQNQYYAGMPLPPNCPCSMAPIFKEKHKDISSIPYATTLKCKHMLPATFVPAPYAPEGFYLFKRKRKRAQPTYPKTSTIIHF